MYSCISIAFKKEQKPKTKTVTVHQVFAEDPHTDPRQSLPYAGCPVFLTSRDSRRLVSKGGELHKFKKETKAK